MKITEPGVYDDIPADEYHADPCAEPSLSSSIAKLLVTPGGTPMHARNECPRLNEFYEPEESEKFDLGAAAHALLLRDRRAFAIIDAPDWKKQATRDLRDVARVAGKIPILAEQYERAVEMVTSARIQLDRHEEGRHLFLDGVPEQTIVWREGEVLCRARLDWRHDNGPFFPDYKSTAASADPDLWSRTMYGMDADMQAAFYLRGIRALKLHERPQWRFVVQENYKPFALSVIGLMPGALDLADRQITRAIDIWAACLRENRWQGYPTRTCWVDAPEWREAGILNREARDADGKQLQRAREAQAPL